MGRTWALLAYHLLIRALVRLATTMPIRVPRVRAPGKCWFMDVLQGAPTLVLTSHRVGGVDRYGIGRNMSQFPPRPVCAIVQCELDVGAWRRARHRKPLPHMSFRRSSLLSAVHPKLS